MMRLFIPKSWNTLDHFIIFILIFEFSLHKANSLEPDNSIAQNDKTLKDPSKTSPFSETELYGMSFQHKSDKKRVIYDPSGSPTIYEGMELKITLFGKFAPNSKFRLTTFQTCDNPKDKSKKINVQVDPSGIMGTVKLSLPTIGESYETKAYFCMGTASGDLKIQGKHDGKVVPWLTIKIIRSRIPAWAIWACIVVLLFLSGLFSGLNLGILSIDRMDLKIMINTGTPMQRKHARKIRPVRLHGNFLLCSLVFSNVLVNSTLTLLMDDQTDGFTALIASTFAIVIIGEIIPQAVCSRHGLAVAGYTISITKIFMAITFVLAFPMSKILDQFLGEEICAGYTRERLKELVKAIKDEHLLGTEEVGIISGTLDLKQKTVKQIMKKIGDVFVLPLETILDFNTMIKIEHQGYSRIPIYDGEITNVIALLNVKQLIMVDCKDNIPLRKLVDLEYYRDNLFCVFENTRLDFMFRKFREGNRGHMAFVDRVNDDGPGDPFYERIGVVTMEDVLEELLQQEIIDESDVGSHSARLAAHFF